MLRSLIILITCIISKLCAIPVDNGIQGEPEIDCGADSIGFTANTQHTFEGHVFIKGRYTEAGCRNDQVGRPVATITLGFTQCGVSRRRSLNPRGIYVSVSVVITFHPLFLTKVDRAYTVECFYMEADKTVSSEVEVSMLTTAFQTQVVPMPKCRYEILDGGPSAAPIRFAIVGQQVYHKWTCDAETAEIFCMTVHSCFVDDIQGNKVDLLDPNGCALDKYLLNNLDYLADLMAGKESHVFKYADQPQLFFNCQIGISIKEPNQECTKPQCPEPTRGKRQITSSPLFFNGIVDVQSQTVNVLDILGSNEILTTAGPDVNKNGVVSMNFAKEVCVSQVGFGLLIILLFLISTLFIVLICLL